MYVLNVPGIRNSMITDAAKVDEMYDLATQLVAKWARGGPEARINVTDDYTRLTLDSIALCAMGKRFNSFYSEEMHPFVGAMVRFLVESGMRPRKTRLESFLWREPERQYWKDIEYMKGVCKELIEHRRANPVEKKDLLNAMLFGRDPKTKERLTDESVVNNMITFLIAGHETTSGMLSFITYYLLKSPDACDKARKEVDTVVGTGPVTVDHLTKLPYLEAIMREALRLTPTAPGFSITSLPGHGDQVIGGAKYHIPDGATIFCNLSAVGRDKTVFGEDADDFRPERMLGENFAKLPPNAWKVSCSFAVVPQMNTLWSYLLTILLLAFWKWCKRLHWKTVCLARGPPRPGIDITEF